MAATELQPALLAGAPEPCTLAPCTLAPCALSVCARSTHALHARSLCTLALRARSVHAPCALSPRTLALCALSTRALRGMGWSWVRLCPWPGAACGDIGDNPGSALGKEKCGKREGRCESPSLPGLTSGHGQGGSFLVTSHPHPAPRASTKPGIFGGGRGVVCPPAPSPQVLGDPCLGPPGQQSLPGAAGAALSGAQPSSPMSLVWLRLGTIFQFIGFFSQNHLRNRPGSAALISLPGLGGKSRILSPGAFPGRLFPDIGATQGRAGKGFSRSPRPMPASPGCPTARNETYPRTAMPLPP